MQLVSSGHESEPLEAAVTLLDFVKNPLAHLLPESESDYTVERSRGLRVLENHLTGRIVSIDEGRLKNDAVYMLEAV